MKTFEIMVDPGLSKFKSYGVASSPEADRYDVNLSNAKGLGPVFEGKSVVFHGINKSGSLAMADIMREAYFHAGRGDQFISHYHKSPPDYESMIAKAEQPTDRQLFFVGHYLYNVVNSQDIKLWITQLRHPLPRLVSCYQWSKNKHKKRTGTFEGFPSLEQFIVAGGGKRHSLIVQFAPGGVRGTEGKKMSKKAMLETAIAALESRISWFGIAEYFEESIFALAHLCGIPSVVAWRKDTRNAGRRLTSELSSLEVDLITETYAEDIALYDYAKAMFHKRIKDIDFGKSFPEYKIRCAGEYKDRII